MMLLRALAASVPRLPLFCAAVDAVGRLVEMCADDTAARSHRREALLCGLVTLVGPPRSRGTALGPGDTAVMARAARQATPHRSGARLRQRVLPMGTLSAFIPAPVGISFDLPSLTAAVDECCGRGVRSEGRARCRRAAQRQNIY